MANNWDLETEKNIFFWGGCFSNWYKVSINLPLFEDAQSETFNCVEQYMMAAKAHEFVDETARLAIMKASNPKQQKALGRMVAPFDPDKWNNVARDRIYPAIYMKFNEHEDLKKILLSTGKKIIAEASPFDRVWGIGMGWTEEGIDNPANWKGTNFLGEVIMRVRDHIEQGVDFSFKPQKWK